MPDYEPTIIPAAINAAKNGTRDLIAAPGTGNALWIYYIKGYADAAGTVLFIDSTPTSHTGIMPVGATGNISLGDSSATNWRAPVIKCAENTKLQVTLPAGNDFDGVVLYAIIPTSRGG